MSKTSKEESALIDVLNYMTNQNRPYSCNDVVQNLHNQYSKTVVQKAFDELVEVNFNVIQKKGKIIEKCYGKQKVYLVCQDGFETCTAAELQQMDDVIADLESKLMEKESALKQVKSKHSKLCSSATTEQLKDQLAKLEERVANKKLKLDEMKKTFKKMDRDKINQLRGKKDKLEKELNKKKKTFKEILGTILESSEMSMKELLEKVDLELEDD